MSNKYFGYDYFGKYHLSSPRDELKVIDDYGIYDYFKYNDTKCRSKMIARIADNNYVINTGDTMIVNHIGLTLALEKKFGACDIDLGSNGNELNVSTGSSISISQINTLIGVFSELKKYYEDTNINKNILFIGQAFEKRLDKYKDCSNIDGLLEELNKIKIEKLEEVETYKQLTLSNAGYVRLWIIGLLTLFTTFLIIFIGVLLNY